MSDDPPHLRRCSWCGSGWGPLAVGPHDVAICEACLALCRAIVPEEGRPPADREVTCSFCEKPSRCAIAGPVAFICDRCVYRLS